MVISESDWNFPAQVKWLYKYMKDHNGFVAGGAFKDIFEGKQVRDLDMFFKSKEDWIEAVDMFKDNEDYAHYYTNNNVTAFKHKVTGVVVECICKVFGEPEEIINNFDFTIAKMAYDYVLDPKSSEEEPLYKGIVYYSDKFFEHLTLKRLVIDDKLLYPMDTFHRLFKYAKKGFYPCRMSKIKMMKAIHDIEDISLVDNISFYLADGID